MFSRENEFKLHDNEYYVHINYTSERIYATRGFHRTLYLWYRSNIFCSFICSFLPPHCKLLKHLLSVQCVQCTNVFIFLVIYFFFILVPRLSGKEQLLFSFVKMAEPESIGGGTDTDHHDNKLVKAGFHTMQLCIL